MNVQDIIVRAIQEDYNNGGTASDFLTPLQVAHWIDKAVFEYWGVFQDNEYSYYSVNEYSLNVNIYNQIYPVPNGDPAQVDTITFSAVPTSGAYTIKITQNSINYDSSSIAFGASAATVQAAINAGAGPQCTVTSNWNVTNGIGNQIQGFTILWDISTVPTTYSGGAGAVSYRTFTNTTGVTITATPGVANINNPNIGFISSMAIRTGSAPNFGYTPISTIQPNQQFGGANSIQAAVWRYTQAGSGAGVVWSLSGGTTDGNGYATLNIRVDGWPTQPFLLVYNGLRYPTKVPILASGQPLTTYRPDLPEHFHDGIVLRVLKSAYIRAKADTSDLDTLIKQFDETQKAVEERSVQRQGPDLIEDVRGWG